MDQTASTRWCSREPCGYNPNSTFDCLMRSATNSGVQLETGTDNVVPVVGAVNITTDSTQPPISSTFQTPRKRPPPDLTVQRSWFSFGVRSESELLFAVGIAKAHPFVVLSAVPVLQAPEPRALLWELPYQRRSGKGMGQEFQRNDTRPTEK